MGALIISVVFVPANEPVNVTEPAVPKSSLPPFVVPMVIELALVSKIMLVNGWSPELVTAPLSAILNIAVSPAIGTTGAVHEVVVFHSPPPTIFHTRVAAAWTEEGANSASMKRAAKLTDNNLILCLPTFDLVNADAKR